jgi:hypothetical protein
MQPGRAEATRLLLKLGKVPHEDYRFPREEWPAIKAKMPYGQVPVLEVRAAVELLGACCWAGGASVPLHYNVQIHAVLVVV